MLLITGATGFVGRSLLHTLSEKNSNIRCLVRDRHEIHGRGGWETVHGDLTDVDSLCAATENINTVIHLAAVMKSSDPKEFMEINVQGTRNLLDACLKNGVRKIIYVSTLDVAFSENSLYGKTKAMGEELVKNSTLDYTILRPSFIYGKHSENIAFLAKTIRKYPLVPVAGNGKGKLQPVYIGDVCGIITKLIDHAGKNTTYHIAGEQKISLNDLIDKIAELYSKKVIKVHVPLWFLWLPLKLHSRFAANASARYESLRLLNYDKTCDIGAVQRDLDFRPLSIDDGLRLTLQGQ